MEVLCKSITAKGTSYRAEREAKIEIINSRKNQLHISCHSFEGCSCYS